jgi:hypothetical protein
VQVMQVRSRKAEQPLYFAVKIMKIKSVIQACTHLSYTTQRTPVVSDAINPTRRFMKIASVTDASNRRPCGRCRRVLPAVQSV